MSDKESTRLEVIYDAVNEQIVIQAAKHCPKTRKMLVHRIAADEFLVPNHGPIWRALRAISDRNLELTPEVARQLILKEGGTEEVVSYFDAIAAREVPNLDFHLSTLQWDATRARVLKSGAPKLLASLQDPKASQSEVMSFARSLARSLEGGGRRFMHRPPELYRSYRAERAARRVKRNVFPLGHEDFDKNLSEGFMPGRTTVSAGLSGAGKSTVWIAFAIMLAKLGRRVLWCCWEMDAHSVLDVATSHMTGIDLTDNIQGNTTDEEEARLDKATAWILRRIVFMANPFYAVEENAKPSNARNLDVLEGYITESGCDVAIYDLWERMLAYSKPDDVTKALYRMQAMHREYSVHGVIIQQLHLKDVENRADKRPTRAAIKGVGSYVEVADLIFGVHREGQFKNVQDNTIETICLKQRKGRPNWAVRWDWDGATCFVGNPKEVPYDPGLENSAEIGDIGSIKTNKSRQRVGRRDQ